MDYWAAYLADCSDLSGINGLQPMVQISKNGGAFISVNRTITGLNNGVYSINLTAQDTDTEGELTVVVTDQFGVADNTIVFCTIVDQYLTKTEFLALQ